MLLVEVFCSPLPAAAAAALADAAGASPAIDVDNCSSSRQVLGTDCHVTCLPGFQLRHPGVNYTCRYDGRALWYPTAPPVCDGEPSSSHSAVYMYTVSQKRVPH